jgi:two-component system, NarL family, sensor histidine kinase DesK
MAAAQDDTGTAAIGGGASWFFIVIWLVYLIIPIQDLLHGPHSTFQLAGTVVGVGAFCVGYYFSVRYGFAAKGVAPRLDVPRRWLMFGLLSLIALILPILVFNELYPLWIYVSGAAGVTLPMDRFRSPLIGGLAATLAMLGEGCLIGVSPGTLTVLLLPCVFTCLGSVGARRTRSLIHQLRTAREEVKQLAATEERLRLARDLHDLAGHSLATITLKAELARRLLEADPAAAARQLADLERVSRQALTDIREAVSGYRRPTLAVELLSARTALAAAGITLRNAADPAIACGLDSEAEAALAWCLREATTNVLRHSAAGSCTVNLIPATVDGRASLTLEIADDGRGAPEGFGGCREHCFGNGLTGLAERLAEVSGSLTAGPAGPRGFRVLATVPVAVAAVAGPEPEPAPTADPAVKPAPKPAAAAKAATAPGGKPAAQSAA